jgi:hypothetical protein
VSVSNNTLVHQPNYNFVAFSLNQNRISEWRQPNRSSVARPSMATQSHEQSPPLYLLLRHMAPRQRQAYLIQTCILRVIDSAPIRASCSTSSSEQFNSFIVPKRSVPGLLLVSVRNHHTLRTMETVAAARDAGRAGATRSPAYCAAISFSQLYRSKVSELCFNEIVAFQLH